MISLFNMIRIEVRREWLLSKSYWIELVADQLFFILGFLVLTGLFEVATRGQYAGAAQMAALIGYLVWRVAGGCMDDVTHSVEEDAQWGTLEQVWLSGAPIGKGVISAQHLVHYLLLLASVGHSRRHWPHFAVAFNLYRGRCARRDIALRSNTYQSLRTGFSPVRTASGFQEYQRHHAAIGDHPALFDWSFDAFGRYSHLVSPEPHLAAFHWH